MIKSLKATLMMWVVALIVVLVPLRLYFELRIQLQRTEAAYDVTLSDWALALGNLVRVTDGRVHFDLNEQTEQSLRTSSTTDLIYYAVLGPDGERLAGDLPLAHGPMPLARAERRIVNVQLEGRPLRMAVHAVPCGARLCQVRVAETLGKREEARREALGFALLFALVFGLVLAVAIWVVVTRAMRPLSSVNEQLAQRSLDDLRPLNAGGVPSEVRPLVQAVTQLLERVSGDAARQRAFIADAAHQLRTPLTALHTEAELALLEPHPPDVHATLERIRRQAQRVARLADQLLMLARTEASTRRVSALEVFDLKSVAQDAAQDWVPRALERGVDLGFQLDSALVRGHRHLVGEVLANLLHNALEYGVPPDAEVAGGGQRGAHTTARITVRTAVLPHAAGAGAAGASMLEVEDNGPGIEAAERPRVLERFYRAPGSRGSGSGLGLAIVADIASSHGARVELLDAEEGPGLRVRLTFAPIESAFTG